MLDGEKGEVGYQASFVWAFLRSHVHVWKKIKPDAGKEDVLGHLCWLYQEYSFPHRQTENPLSFSLHLKVACDPHKILAVTISLS